MSEPAATSSAAGPGGAPVPVDLRDYVRFEDASPTRVRVFATDVLTFDLWCLQPQQGTGVLLLDEVDLVYTVVGGRSWFVTDQGEIGLDPMGSLLVPAGTAHGIDNRAPDPLIVLAAGSPPDVPSDQLRTDAPVSDESAAVRDDDAGRSLFARVRDRLNRG